MSMNKIIIRLPGGGRIKDKHQTQDVSWWSYRSFHIEPDFYLGISNVIKSNPECTFYIVSGGVGAFMYTNLSKVLNKNGKITSAIGCDIVSTLHKIIINNLVENDVNVCPSEIDLENLKDFNKEEHACYFIRPNPNILSTDSLAASVAPIVDADLILFIKEGAPTYHVGFDAPTKITEWSIENIRKKSVSVSGNYLLDSEALDILGMDMLKSLIIPPELLSDFSYNKPHYGFGSKDNYTELKYDLL